MGAHILGRWHFLQHRLRLGNLQAAGLHWQNGRAAGARLQHRHLQYKHYRSGT